jgi:hypothetical protein
VKGGREVCRDVNAWGLQAASLCKKHLHASSAEEATVFGLLCLCPSVLCALLLLCILHPLLPISNMYKQPVTCSLPTHLRHRQAGPPGSSRPLPCCACAPLCPVIFPAYYIPFWLLYETLQSVACPPTCNIIREAYQAVLAMLAYNLSHPLRPAHLSALVQYNQYTPTHPPTHLPATSSGSPNKQFSPCLQKVRTDVPCTLCVSCVLDANNCPLCERYNPPTHLRHHQGGPPGSSLHACRRCAPPGSRWSPQAGLWPWPQAQACPMPHTCMRTYAQQTKGCVGHE